MLQNVWASVQVLNIMASCIITINMRCNIKDLYQYKKSAYYWESTVSEKNNSLFTVEHSSDAKNWSAIGTVDGAGNSSSLNHYSFKPTMSIGIKKHLRLKLTDTEGAFTYSKSIKAACVYDDDIVIISYDNNTPLLTLNITDEAIVLT